MMRPAIHPILAGGFRTHILKSWTLFFEGIISGARTADIRSDEDRDFRVGDRLHLVEWDPVKSCYTGRSAIVFVTYIQRNMSNPCAISRDALKDGYSVLSIKFDGDLR